MNYLTVNSQFAYTAIASRSKGCLQMLMVLPAS